MILCKTKAIETCLTRSIRRGSQNCYHNIIRLQYEKKVLNSTF